MKIYKVKSFAKINLALHVTGKLTKLHKIETIIKFIQLHDLITIKIGKDNNHKISFNGHFSKNIKKNNTVDNFLIHYLLPLVYFSHNQSLLHHLFLELINE